MPPQPTDLQASPIETNDGAFLDPYRVFEAHSSGKATNTGLVVLEAIRARHPDKHVTPFSEKDFDVLRWAAARGVHVASLHDEDQSFVKREYRLAPSRLDGTEETLSDHVVFGKYCMKVQDEQYLLYTAEWAYNLLGATTRLFYLLSPREHAPGASSTAVDTLLLDIGRWTARLHDEIYVFDSGEWVKDDRLWQTIRACSWDDVVLEPGMKQTLSEDIHRFFDSRDLYREFAVPWKRGMIFHGPPGCGKTLSLKAIMSSLDKRADGGVASLVVRRLNSSCIDPQHGIGLIFGHARAMAPCLLVFEDLDSLVTSDSRSYFLNEVDGLENNDGILIVGSTNHLDRLDAGLRKRPGRFDRKLHFKLPSHEQRVLYFKTWRAKLEGNTEVDFDPAVSKLMADLTEGFSFAYLKEALVQSLLSLVRGFANESQTGVDGDIVGHYRSAQPAEVESEDQGVPTHLRENILVQALRRQISELRKDMESAGE